MEAESVEKVEVAKPIIAEEPMKRIPDTSKWIKYSPREIDLSNGCRVMVVGMCPGRQRKKDRNFEVFHGNRTGDLVEEAVKGLHGIYLTNVFNMYCPRTEMKDLAEIVGRGIAELRTTIISLKPKTIICLGDFASRGVTKALNGLAIAQPIVRCVQHPSYVIRFNKGTGALVERIRKEAMSK